MTMQQNSPEQELATLTALTGMNPHIISVSIVVNELAVNTPFIVPQIQEITGLHIMSITRNIRSMMGVGMVDDYPRPGANRHLHPYVKLESRQWGFIEDIQRRIGITSLTDLFEKDWDDIEDWLRLPPRTKSLGSTEE